MEIDKKIIKAMPKTDLHVHLDGSVRISTLIDLANKQKVKLPADSEEGLKEMLVPGIKCKSLKDYLLPFDIEVQEDKRKMLF